jgi:hypothetical protein
MLRGGMEMELKRGEDLLFLGLIVDIKLTSYIIEAHKD